MSDLILDNYIINEPIIKILLKARNELTNGKLATIEQKDDYVRVTCPFHKGGLESNPSCSVYCGDGDLQYGWFHCFTCTESGDLCKFIAKCFDETYEFGKRWLINNFGHYYIITNKELQLEDINLNTNKETKHYLDESVLDEFSNYHPYMTKRKLTDEVIKKFDIKYDPTTGSIVFPVRDLNGKISFLTRRVISPKQSQKRFIIDKAADKSVIYLLYNIIKEKIKTVVVCEGQIDALTSWGYGHPAIALLGAGTSYSQMMALNNSGINNFILFYDNDAAGRKGAERFKSLIRKDVFVTDVIIPPELNKKDINELTKEEFDDLVYKSQSM